MCSKCGFDGSILVRMELVVALQVGQILIYLYRAQWFVLDFETRLTRLVMQLHELARVEEAVVAFLEKYRVETKKQAEAEQLFLQQQLLLTPERGLASSRSSSAIFSPRTRWAWSEERIF